MILAVTGDAVVAAAATVSVAVVGLVGVLVPIYRGQKQMLRDNEHQHIANDTNASLRHMEAMKAIERIDLRLDEHITWHAHQSPQPVTIVQPLVEKKEVA